MSLWGAAHRYLQGALAVPPASDSTFAYETREAALRPYLEQDQRWDEQEQHDLHQRRFAAHDFRTITMGERDAGAMALERWKATVVLPHER